MTSASTAEPSRKGAATSRAPARAGNSPDPGLGFGRACVVFRYEAHRQSLAVAASGHAAEDQTFIDAVSDRDGDDAQHLRCGDIWTVSRGGDYGGKLRPVVIVQDDAFDAPGSITI